MGSTFFNKPVLEQNVQKKKQKPNIQEHLRNLCNIFREKLVVLIERVCFLYLENTVGLSHIEMKPNWGEVRPVLKILVHDRMKGHIDMSTTPDKTGWAHKIKRMEDNVLRKELEKSAFVSDAKSTMPFCYASLDGVNESLGISIDSARDLEKRIHSMYSEILDKPISQVRLLFDCC